MITFLTTLSCIAAEIFVYIGLFILAYKIPRLYLSRYAKKHDITLNELLNENDLFGNLSYNLNCLDGFLILIFVANVMTLFATLDGFSLSEILAGLVLYDSGVLIIMAIGFFADLNDCLKYISDHLYKQFVEHQPIKI
jgi:hypothetical protein